MLKKTLAATAAAVTATAVIGSIASAEVKGSWYEHLDLPAIQPPGPVFGIVWTALYTDIAVASAVAIDRLEPDRRASREFQKALGLNLMLNASWSWVFFKAHRLLPAVVVAGALAASSADLARRAGRAEPAAGLALTPYAAWCTFATVLSAAVWRHNR